MRPESANTGKGDSMLITIVRTVILYFFLILVMRLMGKRQIGQLQPGELVITILISEIAAIPMQDNEIPMLNSMVSVLILVGLEIIVSLIAMKSIHVRSLLQGNSLVVIRDGKLDQKQMKRIRYTVDDLLESLRQKNIFDIGDVQYAIAETDGSLSVLLKPEKRGVTIEDMELESSSEGLQCVLISDGRVIHSEFRYCGMTDEKFKRLCQEKSIDPKKIMLLTIDAKGNMNIIRKKTK